MKIACLSRSRFRLHPVAALVLSLGTLAASGIASAIEPFVVRDIRVEGVQRTDAGTVFSYLPFKVGETFDDEKATRSLKALFATGFFKDVRIEVEGNVLVVIVEERPAIANVEFTGMKEFEKEPVLKALKDTGLAPNEIFDRATLERAEQELKRQYLTRGKYGAVVKTTVTPMERNRVGVTFNIEEGEVATIKQINIVGNKVFTSKELLDELSLTTPGWLTWYSKSDQYTKPKLTADLETIRSYYLNRGYLEFNIESTQVAITPDKKDIYITVNVSEGERYIVSDVKLAGEALVNEEDLKRLILVKPGDVYSAERMTQTTKLIQERLGAFGYAFANANASPEVNREKHEVAFTIFVDPAKRVYVRNINVTGNTKTRDEVVRREMRQVEGGWYDIDKIKLSKERLERLSYFKEVNTDTPQVPGTNDQVDVNVSVTEKPTGSFNIGAGYSNAEKLVLTTSLKQENLFGSGQSASVEVNTSRFNRTVALSTTNPYFTDNGVSRSIDMFYRTTQPLDSSFGYYQIKSSGLGIGFGVPFSEYDVFFFGARVEGTKIDLAVTSPLAYFNYVNTYGEKSVAYIGNVGWQRDSRNNVVTPTSGRFQRATIEATAPTGELRYVRAGYQQTYFYPLTKALTLSLNGQADWGRGYQGRSLPIFKNYYAGGIGSVRGFDTSTLGPKDNNGDPLGGTKRIIGNVELLLGSSKGTDKSFRGFIFADVGNVFGDGQKVTASALRKSVGIGFNWLSPVGALSISYALPQGTKPDDKIQRLQFNIGSGF